MITLPEIKDSFEFFEDWEEKYSFIIDLGKSLPDFPPEDLTSTNLVKGCQSAVWLTCKFDSNRNVLHIRAKSDAFIVSGLLAIVLVAFNDRSPEQITTFDIFGLFHELDILAHLSPTRGNGLRAIVETIQTQAAALLPLAKQVTS